MKCLQIALAAVVVSSPAVAADSRYLERVESPVYEAEGDHAALTKRAVVCANQILKPGQTAAATVLTSDADAGVVVANNAFTFRSGMLEPLARTTLTFQAKDGRFRIVHTDIEQLLTGPGSRNGWTQIGTWKFAGGEKAKARILEISDQFATCVKAPAAASNDW